jgi:hypothetical protein
MRGVTEISNKFEYISLNFFVKVQYQVTQDTIRFLDMNHDLCSKKPIPVTIQTNLAMLGIPLKCKWKSAVNCSNGSKVVEISEVSRRLLTLYMGKKLSVKLNVTFDGNEYSCFETEQMFVEQGKGKN